MWQKAVQFLKEVVEELKKVAWLNTQQVVASTVVVIVLVVAVAAFVGMVDFFLVQALRRILG